MSQYSLPSENYTYKQSKYIQSIQKKEKNDKLSEKVSNRSYRLRALKSR
jgi:hypothetical protein